MKRIAGCWVCALLIGGLLGSVPMYAQLDLEFVTEWYIEGSPACVAVYEPSGEVFVTINNNHRVVKYSANGDFLLEFGREGEIPVGIAVDLAGNSVVAVNINNSHRVVLYSADGELQGKFGDQGSAPGQFLNPQGIAVTSAGLIVIADSGNNRVQVIQRMKP